MVKILFRIQINITHQVNRSCFSPVNVHFEICSYIYIIKIIKDFTRKRHPQSEGEGLLLLRKNRP